eukprot:scaffold536_cov137-Skeletonema_marinoi.AAC.5
MGRYKQWIGILTAIDTIWCERELAAIPDWTSSGHVRRCSVADTHIKSLSSGIYPSILSLPIIMGRYMFFIAPFIAFDTIWCERELAAIPNWTSSAHLWGCSMADTHIKSLSSGIYPTILSLPIIMGRYKQWIDILKAIDTMWCERELAAITNWTSSGHLRAETHIKILSSGILSFYPIVTNHNGPLQAMDWYTNSDRYDMVREGACGHPRLDLIRSPMGL